MNVVLEGLAKELLPKLTAALGGPATGALGAIAGGVSYATSRQAAARARGDRNASLAAEGAERARQIGENVTSATSAAKSTLASGNVKSDTFKLAMEAYGKKNKDKVGQDINKRWEKGNKKSDALSTLGIMAGITAGGWLLGKAMGGFGGSYGKAGGGIFG